MFAEDARPEHFHALTALLGLAPTLIGTGLKWMQGNSRSKRRTELSERLTNMSKTYAEQLACNDAVTTAARVALGGEIVSICTELTTLQEEEKRSSHRSLSSWLMDSFLMFRPYGALAWTIHLLFYAGVMLMSLGLLGVAVEPRSEETGTTLFGFFLIGLVMLGLQRIAVWLHRKRAGVYGIAR